MRSRRTADDVVSRDAHSPRSSCAAPQRAQPRARALRSASRRPNEAWNEPGRASISTPALDDPDVQRMLAQLRVGVGRAPGRERILDARAHRLERRASSAGSRVKRELFAEAVVDPARRQGRHPRSSSTSRARRCRCGATAAPRSRAAGSSELLARGELLPRRRAVLPRRHADAGLAVRHAVVRRIRSPVRRAQGLPKHREQEILIVPVREPGAEGSAWSTCSRRK